MARKKAESDSRVVGTEDELSATINSAIEMIRKKWGSEAIGTVRGLHGVKGAPVDVIPTGSISIDAVLGIGGIPQGRIIEIYGQEGGGKTTLTLQVIAQAQRQGKICAFIDAEHSYDPRYAESLGVDNEKLLIAQPDYGEQALEIADSLLAIKPAVIVVDSVAALVPKAELEGEMGDVTVGAQARMMGQALRKMTGKAASSNTAVIFINQLREKIGAFMGSPETTPGGKALKFYASVRLDVRRIGSVKKGEEVIGNRVKVKVVKHKLAPPFQTCEVDLIFGRGFDRAGELLDFGVLFGVIKKAGSWFSYGDERLGQGRSFVGDLILQREDIQGDILAAFSEHYQMGALQESDSVEEE